MRTGRSSMHGGWRRRHGGGRGRASGPAGGGRARGGGCLGLLLLLVAALVLLVGREFGCFSGYRGLFEIESGRVSVPPDAAEQPVNPPSPARR